MNRNKRLKVAAPQLLDSVSARCLDWNKCCICQVDTGENTVCSARNPIATYRNKGYATLANSLQKIRHFNYKLPSGFAIDVLDCGDGIEDTFIEKEAMWHKSCSLKFTEVGRLDAL